MDRLTASQSPLGMDGIHESIAPDIGEWVIHRSLSIDPGAAVLGQGSEADPRREGREMLR